MPSWADSVHESCEFVQVFAPGWADSRALDVSCDARVGETGVACNVPMKHAVRSSLGCCAGVPQSVLASFLLCISVEPAALDQENDRLAC